mmetsp:Transcript_71915/g.123556  ORF Transcript_71915/g.123556 Transcript_71915/m.123556 type:complete len:156 (+) Transcript_71915:115-582(+)
MSKRRSLRASKVLTSRHATGCLRSCVPRLRVLLLSAAAAAATFEAMTSGGTEANNDEADDEAEDCEDCKNALPPVKSSTEEKGGGAKEKAGRVSTGNVPAAGTPPSPFSWRWPRRETAWSLKRTYVIGTGGEERALFCGEKEEDGGGDGDGDKGS